MKNTTNDWWKKSVIYQIYPRSFMDGNGDGIGDLKGITSRLDYIAELGVDVVWLSPIYKSPNEDMGYDISDYRDIMDEFGTMKDFDTLLKKAHSLNLKILMDLVVNHSSSQHHWFKESQKSLDNPYRNYYIWKDGKKEGKKELPPTNWGSWFSGSAWDKTEQTNQYYLHLFTKGQPDLNWENKKVRKEIYDLMKFWCDKGIDGFRMDVINVISKDPSYKDFPKDENLPYANVGAYLPNGPRVHEFLQEMNKEVLSHYDIMSVGETPGVKPNDAIKYANADGTELNMIFQFEHMEIDNDENGKWTDKKMYLPDLKEVLSKWQVELEGKAWNSLFWNNHDQPRIVSRWGNEKGIYRILSAKMLASCLHFMKGTPYIYQGEELGMTNIKMEKLSDFRDCEIINAHRELVKEAKVFTESQFIEYANLRGRDNARTPMQWDDSENAGFSTAKKTWIAVNPNYKTINAQQQREDPHSVFSFYKKLISLRKEMDIITEGYYTLLDKENESIFSYLRTSKKDEEIKEEIIIICNFTKNTKEYTLPSIAKELILSNYDETVYKGEKTIMVKPYEALVLKTI